MPHHSEWLFEVISNCVVVDFTERRAFFSADAAGEITEVVDGQRNVSGARFANWFAVVQSFGQGQKLQVLFHFVGDLQQNHWLDPRVKCDPRDP